jgi:hypothetical protein
MARFIPCPLAMVPTASQQALQRVFDDIDADCGGTLTRGQVMDAFSVNRIRLSDTESAALLDALDPDHTDRITTERFVCCIYALSTSIREVSSPAVYSVFPDSEFTSFTATGTLRLRRSIWLVSAVEHEEFLYWYLRRCLLFDRQAEPYE